MSSQEHVIGRKFVPKGALQGSWNLILNACGRCNNAKFDLEDDISAITMQSDPTGRHTSNDPRLVTDAQRKARGSFSRLTSKPVEHSAEGFQVQHPHGPITFTFRFNAPPQMDERRAFCLAEYHVRAFFDWCFYDEDLRKGKIWIGDFAPVHIAPCGDWGNPVNRWFMQEIVEWKRCVLAIGADGFLKILLRQHDDHPVWAWALEWNQNLRIIGFCGDLTSIDAVAASMPKLDLELLHEVPGQFSRYFRMEQALDPADDDLFDQI
jgi:hypothetical protein